MDGHTINGRVGVWILLSVLGLSLPAAAQQLPRQRALPTLGGNYGVATDINDFGVIVGESSLTNNSSPETPNVDPPHASLWLHGSVHDLGALAGANVSRANAINNKNQVVGRSGMPGGYDHAFLWDRGTMKDLGVLDANATTEALDINDRGQIVGYSGQNAVLWDRGAIQTLPNPGGGSSRAVAINNRGVIAGYVNRNETIAVIWERGVLRELGVLEGGTFSVATGISDRSQVLVRGNTGSDFTTHAAIWEDGVFTELASLVEGGAGSSPEDINLSGVVVGTGPGAPGELAGVIWRRNGAVVRLGPGFPTAINAFGVIVGSAGARPVVWY